MIGFLTFIPTVAYIPHMVYMLIVFYLIIKKGKNIKFGSKKNFFTLTLIISLGLLNNFLHPQNFEVLKDYFPFIILILVSYLAALNFTRNDAKVLIYLISFESLVVIAESIMGVSTFFTSLDNYTVFADNSLLYFNRPFGLSTNSSSAALKIMVAILLIYFFNFKDKIIDICKVLLFIGFVLTFNRTVIVALIFFYGLYFFSGIIKLKISKIKLGFIVFGFSILFLGLMFYSDEIFTKIINQFTRNSGKIELTGRGAIWKQYINFIEQNFFFGNGSFKYLLDNYVKGKIYHAHNSYLQVMATHGFIIFCLYMWLIFSNLNKNNYLYIFTIMLFSFSQYGIFWGVSLLDIVFFVFLFRNREKLNLH